MKIKFDTGLTVGDLRKIIKDMDDDAIVTARDRDCMNLEMFHVVNHPTIKSTTADEEYVRQSEFGNAIFVKKIKDVYGGENLILDNKSKQALVFCDSD